MHALVSKILTYASCLFIVGCRQLDCGVTSDDIEPVGCALTDGVCVINEPSIDLRVRSDEDFLVGFSERRGEGASAAIPCSDGVHFATLRTDGYAPLGDDGFPAPGRRADEMSTAHFVQFNVFAEEGAVAVAAIDFRAKSSGCPYMWLHSAAADVCLADAMDVLSPVWQQCSRDGQASVSRCECFINELPGRNVLGCG